MTNGGGSSGSQGEYQSTPPDEFFRTLVAASPDAIVSLTTDGTICYANDAVEQVFGYAPDELTGESVGVLVPDRFHESFRRRAKRYLSDGVKPINRDGAELVGEHKDGTEVPISVTIVEHDVRDRRRFTAVVRDITRRMEREDYLVRKTERLRDAADAVESADGPLSDADAALRELREAYDDERLEDLEAAHKRIRDAIAHARCHRNAADDVDVSEFE